MVWVSECASESVCVEGGGRGAHRCLHMCVCVHECACMCACTVQWKWLCKTSHNNHFSQHQNEDAKQCPFHSWHCIISFVGHSTPPPAPPIIQLLRPLSPPIVQLLRPLSPPSIQLLRPLTTQHTAVTTPYHPAYSCNNPSLPSIQL